MQDLLILRILQTNGWERPVYFAMTTSRKDQIGLDRYLRLDGMAFLFMPCPDVEMDVALVRDRMLNTFQYRGLNDPDVYLNIDTVRMLTNLRQLFLQLAKTYLERGRQDQAAEVLREMERRIPETTVPYIEEYVALVVSEHFRRAGVSDDYEARLEHVIPNRHMGNRDRRFLADYYSRVVHDWKRAEENYLALMDKNPDDNQSLMGLLRIYVETENYAKGISVLESWLERHPGDAGARERFRLLKAMQDGSVRDSNVPATR